MFSGANPIFIGQITGKIQFIFRNFHPKMGQLKCESFIFGRIWFSLLLSCIDFIQFIIFGMNVQFFVSFFGFAQKKKEEEKTHCRMFVSSTIVY